MISYRMPKVNGMMIGRRDVRPVVADACRVVMRLSARLKDGGVRGKRRRTAASVVSRAYDDLVSRYVTVPPSYGRAFEDAWYA